MFSATECSNNNNEQTVKNYTKNNIARFIGRAAISNEASSHGAEADFLGEVFKKSSQYAAGD